MLKFIIVCNIHNNEGMYLNQRKELLNLCVGWGGGGGKSLEKLSQFKTFSKFFSDFKINTSSLFKI